MGKNRVYSRLIRTVTVMWLAIGSVEAQQAYFVDGYHGGIYGHYPLWVTSFMVDHLAAHPDWRIGLEIEPETWDTVRHRDPEGYTRFRALALSDRVDFTNPTYAQPYLYNISGESIIRQFAYGIRKYREHFPGIHFTTYAVEEPCFTSSLPQILKQFEFQYAVLKCPNTCWGGYTRAHGGELVNWIGPDGTAILTVPRYGSEALEPGSTWQTTAWNNSPAFLQSSFAAGIQRPVGMCYQDAGWKNGPWLGLESQTTHNSRYVTWTEYFTQVSPGATEEDWHFSQEDLQVNLMWGSQVLQRIARQVRTAENRLIMAEKIGAMARVEQGVRPDSAGLAEAWRTLMLAQHHDSWIVPYNKLRKTETWADVIRHWTDTTCAIAEQEIARVTGGFSTGIGGTGRGALAPVAAATANDRRSRKNESDGITVRVYNTVAQPRREPVTIALPGEIPVAVYDSRGKSVLAARHTADGHPSLTFLADVPAFGYATYTLRTDATTARSAGRSRRADVRFDAEGHCIIENDQFRLVLDKFRGGVIRSLKAKYAGGREFAADTGRYRLGELSGYFYDEGRWHSSTEAEARFTVLEDHALRIKVRIDGAIAGHPISQVVTLEAGQPRVDVELTIDWQGPVGIGEYRQTHSWTDNRRAYTDDRYKLNVLFPARLRQSALYKNAPFDVVRSQQPDTYFNRWDQIKHNVVLHWIDVLDEQEEAGLAVLTDHTGSYVNGPDMPLGLTAQYAGVGLWGWDYRITGPLHMRYALIPHTGSWETADIAGKSEAWNQRLLVVTGVGMPVTDRSLITFDQKGYELSTAVAEANGDLTLRLFNASGDDDPQTVRLGFLVSALTEVQLSGREIGAVSCRSTASGTTFTVQMPRFGIKTIRVRL